MYRGSASPGKLLPLLEIQRSGVDAVPEPRRLRSVVEHVPQVRAAARADHLDAEELAPTLLGHVLLRDGRREAGPSGARVELGAGGEEIVAAADTLVDARVVRVPVGAGEGPLRAALPGHDELLLGEALLPLLVGLLDLVGHHVSPPLG